MIDEKIEQSNQENSIFTFPKKYAIMSAIECLRDRGSAFINERKRGSFYAYFKEKRIARSDRDSVIGADVIHDSIRG